jgi:hypothetical protein
MSLGETWLPKGNSPMSRAWHEKAAPAREAKKAALGAAF